jgi:hypothetical protein
VRRSVRVRLRHPVRSSHRYFMHRSAGRAPGITRPASVLAVPCPGAEAAWAARPNQRRGRSDLTVDSRYIVADN